MRFFLVLRGSLGFVSISFTQEKAKNLTEMETGPWWGGMEVFPITIIHCSRWQRCLSYLFDYYYYVLTINLLVICIFQPSRPQTTRRLSSWLPTEYSVYFSSIDVLAFPVKGWSHQNLTLPQRGRVPVTHDCFRVMPFDQALRYHAMELGTDWF